MYLPHGRATTESTKTTKFFIFKAENGYFRRRLKGGVYASLIKFDRFVRRLFRTGSLLVQLGHVLILCTMIIGSTP